MTFSLVSNPSNAMSVTTRALARRLMVLPLLVASIAFAADKPVKKEATFGTGKPGGAYLTRDQLRACFGRQEKVAADDAELRSEQNAITSQKTELARIGDELKATLDTVDRTSAEAVAGYNDAVQARDRQIDVYQARVTAFNTRVEASQQAHDSFKQGCSNRRYFEEDELAIKKGK